MMEKQTRNQSHNDPSGDRRRPILIFPGGMPRSLDFLSECLSNNQAVVGASSLAFDPSRPKYPSWLHLPYVNQPDFMDALANAVHELGIGGIYTPNPVIWNYLNELPAGLLPGVALVNRSPINAELNGYRTAHARAKNICQEPLQLATSVKARLPIPEIELAALLRHAAQIPGMCDNEKIHAMCEIARLSPDGDIVEIGSWWGKSAFVLARLARCHNIGSLLCVDPWSNDNLVQDGGGGLVDSTSSQLDADEALVIFEMNLIPYSENHVNYLRMPSTTGAKYYLERKSVKTQSFGTTEYRGQISILHIDGNHSHSAVLADIFAWSRFVAPGGWLIVDDYLWPYGDGPRIAADEFLAKNSQNIDVAFVMGGAMFLQLAAN